MSDNPTDSLSVFAGLLELDADASHRLAKNLLDPPEPNEALRRAAARYMDGPPKIIIKTTP